MLVYNLAQNSLFKIYEYTNIKTLCERLSLTCACVTCLLDTGLIKFDKSGYFSDDWNAYGYLYYYNNNILL